MDPLFERSAPAVREIFEALLRLVREVMPDATEQLDLPDHLVAFGFGPPGGVRMRGLAVGLVPHAAHVNGESMIRMPVPTGYGSGIRSPVLGQSPCRWRSFTPPPSTRTGSD